MLSLTIITSVMCLSPSFILGINHRAPGGSPYRESRGGRVFGARYKTKRVVQIWPARRARWNLWRKTGVNWLYVESQWIEATLRHQRRLNGCPQKCTSRTLSTNFSRMKDESCCKVKSAKPCVSSSFTQSQKQNTMSSRLHRRTRAKKTRVEQSKTMTMQSSFPTWLN